MITELISSPQYIREQLAHFQSHDLAELIQSTALDESFSARLTALARDLRSLISRCQDSLTVSQTSAVLETWDTWCESFEQLEHPDFEEEILQTFTALPQ